MIETSFLLDEVELLQLFLKHFLDLRSMSIFLLLFFFLQNVSSNTTRDAC